MTRPSLAGIEQRAEVFHLHVPVSRCDTWEHGSSCPGVERCKNCRRRWPCTFITDAEAAFIAHARTDLPALTAAVRDVLALHQGDWSCWNPTHTNPDVVCPECWECCADCDQAWPCATVRALATHLDLTAPEGDPT